MAKKITVRDVYTGRRDILTESEYNAQMKKWSEAVLFLAKQKASLMRKGRRRSIVYKSGPKRGKREDVLRSHIKYKLYSDAGDVAGVGFQFPRHGIFLEYGVGRGHGVNRVRRTMSDWLSGALQKKEADLVDIIGEYYAGHVINKTGIGGK